MIRVKANRRMGLLNQVLAANVILVGTSLACLAAFLTVQQRWVLQDQLEARAELLAESLARQSELAMLVNNRNELQRIAAAALSNADVLYIKLADSAGKLTVTASRPDFALSAIPPLAPVGAGSRIVEGPEPYSRFIDVTRPLGSQMGPEILDWDAPVSSAPPRGVARVGVSMAKQRLLFVRTLANGMTVAITAMILIAAVHYFQLRRILRPLHALVTFSRRVAAGDLKQRAPVTTIDEVFDLTTAFNHMVEELEVSRQDLVRLVEEAQQANRLKSEFLANVSHEIRTPMNGILGMTELILQTHLTPEQQDYTATVRESASALLAVINDVLDFSRIEAGKMSLDPDAFALHDLLGNVMRTLAVRAHQKEIEMLCRIAPGTPGTLVADATRLRQILLNLIGNAVKFTEKGEVEVSVWLDEETAEALLLHFEIRDTGIGIAPDRQRAVFEAFTQADGSTTRKYGGTGLGLSICARLVDLMGGRIWVESRPGQGSRFHFTMHARRGADTGAQDGRRERPLQGQRVLIVDDNAACRDSLGEYCTAWGMTANLAADIPEGIECLRAAKAEARPYDLALLDAQMPAMKDLALVARARDGGGSAETVIIPMTQSHSAPLDSECCRRLGVRGHLAKPVMPAELLQAILEALGLDSAKQEEIRVEAPAAPSTVLAGKRVLVAEDHPVNRKLVSKLLEKRSLVPVMATDGHEVLHALQSERFDLILMDIQMPGMDGLQATIAIREREQQQGGHIPILAMTAHALDRDRERCLDAGMDAYVSKPVQPDELYQAIESLLANPDVY